MKPEMTLTSSASLPLAGVFLFFSIPVVGSRRPNLAAATLCKRGHQRGGNILKKYFCFVNSGYYLIPSI